MNDNNRWTFFLLGIITVVNIYAEATGHQALQFITKPLLMPLLIVAYIVGHDRKNVYSRLIISGLFFSWMGDIFLMMQDLDGIYFILGLCCFLTTHIIYIIYFTRILPQGKSFFKQYPLLLAVVYAYGASLLYMLWPTLGELKIPVLVYALIICTMLTMAIWQYKRIAFETAVLFIFGAALFVISDTFLAINKFSRPFPFAGTLIMATYVGAQVMIAMGSLSHLHRKVPVIQSQPAN